MICLSPALFWILLALAMPGVLMGTVAGWFLIESLRIYWAGK